jgi:hypothetical protein
MATIQIEITDQSKTAFFMELLQTFQDAGWLTVNNIDGKEITKEEFNTLLHEEKIKQAKKLLEQ